MGALESVARVIFPDLPVGTGLGRVLWAYTDAIEASAVYLVQLSPLIVPLLLGIAIQVRALFHTVNVLCRTASDCFLQENDVVVSQNAISQACIHHP